MSTGACKLPNCDRRIPAAAPSVDAQCPAARTCCGRGLRGRGRFSLVRPHIRREYDGQECPASASPLGGHSDATLRSVLAAGFRRRRGNRDGTAERCGAQTCGAGNLHGRANQYTDFFGRARSSPCPPWQMGPAQAERPTKGLGILFGVWLAYAASPGGARLARRAGGVARVAPRRDGEPWRVGMRPGCRGSGRSGWGSRCDLLPRCSSFL